jgi:hypothetical protein
MTRTGWGTLSLVALVACSSGYDGEYDCEQSAACQQRITGEPYTDTQIEICTDYSDDAYDGLSDTQQDYLDDVFEACEEETSCAYIVCVCEYSGRDDTTCEEARQHR